MTKPLPPADPDRVIAPGTVPRRGVAGDANALWRYQRQRRRALLARPGPHPVVLVLDRLRPDYNVAKIYRSAHAFGAREVHQIAIGPFDPAPAKGGFKHVPTRYWESFAPCRAALEAEGYALILLDPAAPTLLPGFPLPERSAFVLGSERDGLSGEARQTPLPRLRIPQFGPVESLNVAVAAAIALYEWLRQHAVKSR
ncbi:MAG: TrmH family RNA methyltransferase [Xanthomonadales bacterium]|nr:TrmH family RNA methyltransferase [Xanthomonadales bacterium]